MQSILKSINKENFNDYLSSIERCIGVLQSFFITLDSYKVIRNNPQEESLKFIEAALKGAANAIELEVSYKLFCELVGAEYKQDGEKVAVIPVLLLAESIQPHCVPLFPWQSLEDNQFQVYTNQNEAIYYQDLGGTRNKIVEKPQNNISFKLVFEKNTLSVIQEMKRHIRSREVLSLYQTIILMNALNQEFDFIFEGFGNLDDELDSILTNHKKSKQVKKNAIKNRVKELFIKHYEETDKILQERGSICFDKDIEEDQWIRLQEKVVLFGQGLYKIEQQFKTTLEELHKHIKNRDENNKLLREIDDFIKINKLATYKEDIIENFPTARQISGTKPGGPGILKRITDSGGLPQFEKRLRLYQERNKRTMPDLPPQSFESNSYEGAIIKGTLKNKEND